MGVVRKLIHISLHTTIENNGDKEIIKNTYKGKYVRKGNVEVITYTEITDGFGDINNRITLHPNKVNIKRSGQITMNQQFIVNHRTESLYRHPYGNMTMEIDTKEMTRRSLSSREAGQVRIVYDVHLTGKEISEHFLVLTYTEEK